MRSQFAKIGKNVSYNYKDLFTYKNIYIDDDVYIGPGAVFLSSDSTITIGKKVLFGPNVTIITGDHATELRGKYMFDITEKQIGEDMPVVIKDDVWVGTGAIILKGVNIGQGSIIAAGSIITEDVDEYAIMAGVPGKLLRYRGNEEEISNHRNKILK